MRTVVNAKLRGIGELTELSIDTAEQKARAKLVLLGERRPVEIRIEKYRADWKRNVVALTVLDATASRVWFEAALRTFVVGRRFRTRSNSLLKVLT